MERVKKFRETRERMGEASLAAAAAKLQEAERGLARAREAELGGARDVVRAMEDGERAMSLALREAFGLDCEWYEQERLRREETMRLAREMLRERRIESEQVAVLHQKMREEMQREEERRAEAEGVDRFLARGRWSAAKAHVRALTETA
jgi:hypothetical protein